MDKRQQYMRENTSESGVALVFALAMLALLLLMLIGFLASAIFEQRIAYNQSGQSITRTIARSALQHASNMLAVYDGIVDEIPAFTGYAEKENKSGPITDTTPAWRMTPLSSINHTDIDNMGDAFDLIKKLLQNRGINHDNYVWDKEIGDKKNIPQWVPMIVKVGDKHSHITGRFAYTIIPNLGIEPNLLNDADPTERIGLKYKELPFSGLELGSGNWQRIFNQPKWMSLDVLGSKYVLGKDLDKTPWEKEMPDTVVARDDFREKEKTTFMELVNTFFTTDQDRSVDFDEDRINLAEVGTQANADKIADLIASDSTLKKQIAANIVDYIDADSIPTSDVTDTKTWLTSEHPTFTGNEKTPYINQIVPAFELTGTYTVEKGTAIDEMQSVTRNLSFAHKGKIYVELINIYPAQLSNVRKIVIKDVSFTLKGEIRWGTAAGESFTPAATGSNNSKAVSQVFSKDQIEIDTGADITVSANGYAVATADVTFTGSIPAASDTRNMSTGVTPAADVDLKIRDFKFERAVLLDKDGNGLDFVKGMTVPDGERNFIGTVENTTDPLMPDNRNAWVFTTSGSTFTSAAYADFQVNDPRCNLTEDNWKIDFVRDKAAVTQHTDLELGAKNKDAEVKNTELPNAADEATWKDLESAEDPANVSTAYIRDGVMTSVWELGFIHRGKPWQTINLKSANHTKEKTYVNDAVLLDEIAFYDPDASADDKEKEKKKKYNINYPYTHIAAFGPLVKGLKYCPVNKTDIIDAGGLYPESEGKILEEDEWQGLRKWIAWKCHKSKDGNPSKFDGAENYHFYRHRGYLANVITDWAVNSDDSPYKGKDIKEVHLEELISKITPLTRAGEPYEYFTIYIVAQTIKDVGGLTEGKKMVRYNHDGSEVPDTDNEAKQGRWDPKLDEITGEVFMVARVRRNLDCLGNDSCKDGKHVGGCQYGITVIESYTINEL